MFNNPVKPDSRLDEGTVLQIDPKRQVCKVLTMAGQKLDSVQWLQPYGGNERHGDRVTPRMGDKVLLSHGLGYPIIIGFLPRSQSGSSSYPIPIDGGVEPVDAGNYSPGGAGLRADASRPSDMLLGDRVITSQGGGMLALLRAGSLVLRSSRAAEIMMSRLGDLVRVMSRNFEHFTDLSSDVYRNFRGRVYRYFGVTHLFSRSQAEDYQYHQYYGDTAAAEAVKTSYHTPPATIPAATNIIFKEQITGQAGDQPRVELMRRTVDLTGTEEVYITNGEVFTRMRTTNGVITLSFKDEHTITIDQGKINAHHHGGADILMNNDGITSTFQDGKIEMKAGGITSTFSGTKVEMKSSGVETTFSGHFVKVNGSGVELG